MRVLPDRTVRFFGCFPRAPLSATGNAAQLSRLGDAGGLAESSGGAPNAAITSQRSGAVGPRETATIVRGESARFLQPHLSAMKRLIELDVLRGVLMLMMVVNHSPSSLRRFTDQPVGFFTTAEAFVFVSAFLAGLLFHKRIEKNGFNAATSSSIHRAGRIYCAHLLTLAFAFVIGSFFLTYLPGLRTLFEQYLKNPPAAIAASTPLVFQPPLMDILPMYILFSFLTPLVFWAAGKCGWKTVMFTSLLGYLKSSRSSTALGDRPSTILVNRPQHVACLLLADRPIGASNRYNPIAQKRRAVLFYSRDLPIVNSILARSLL